MRSLVATLFLAAIVACSDRGAPAPAPAPRDRPLALDGSVARAVTSTPDRARVELDLAAARGAVRAYHAEHAAWPRALADLSLEGTLNYPADLAYDPATGAVTSRTYPSY
jgi:hypothetical protein